jgi:hypothetical protein
MRKHHKWLMIVIAILAVPFIFYFNKTDLSRTENTDLGRIYDRPLTNIEFQRSARLMTLGQMLGLSVSQELMGRAMSESDAYVNFAFNRIVLEHEGRELGVLPSSTEIAEHVKTLRPFQNEQGGFDFAKYNDFAQARLPALGFTEAQLEQMVSAQLVLNRVKDLLGTGIHFAESESRDYYERSYGKIHAAVVRFREEDFQKDLKISDEDIAKYFEAHKAELKTEEKRKVEFVSFLLNPTDKAKTGKERTDALQKLADRANEFVQGAMKQGTSFPDFALTSKVALSATGEFTAAAPDPQFAAIPALSQYAFQLKPEEPISDAIQGPDGFYVLHLVSATPSKPLTPDEAKPKIVENLTKERLRQMVSTKGADVARVIREATGAGTPLDKALSQIGLTAERVPPFAISEPPPKPEEPKKPDVPDLPMIKSAVRELNPGDSTDFMATEKGGLVVVVESRDPADQAGYAEARAKFEKNFLQNKRMVYFDEWLQDRRRAAGVQQAVTQAEAPAAES